MIIANSDSLNRIINMEGTVQEGMLGFGEKSRLSEIAEIKGFLGLENV